MSDNGRIDLFRQRKGQRGASLIVALAVMAFIALTSTALVGFLLTSMNSTSAYRSKRDASNSGDSAMKAAIEYVAASPELGRDPSLFDSSNAQPDSNDSYTPPGTTDPISVTCAAVDGTKSGIPNATGLVPEDAIRTLGTRYGELPLYPHCTGTTSNRRNSIAGAEVGVLVDHTLIGSSNNCATPASSPDFGVDGNIRSNSPIRVNNGALRSLDPTATIQAASSPLLNNNPCIGAIGGFASCTKKTQNPAVPSNGSSPWGTADTDLFQDPAKDGSPTKDQWRIEDINWNPGTVSINGGAPVGLGSAPVGSCTGNGNDLVKFYPGWYKNVTELNNVFRSSCSNGVFWFMPSATKATMGAATTVNYDVNEEENARGVYLFDFRDQDTRVCHYLGDAGNLPSNNPQRWCADPNIANGGPRIVGGTPERWDPVAFVTNTSGGNASVTLPMGTAGTIDERGSLTWANSSNATALDGSVTQYSPGACALGICRSNDRAIGLRDFGPRVTAVDSTGELTVTVAHGEFNGSRLDDPLLRLSTIDRGLAVECGSFSFPKANLAAGSVATHTISTNDAKTSPGPALSSTQKDQLRQCFLNAERANNVSAVWTVGGDNWNLGSGNIFSPQRPIISLDGITFQMQSLPGNWFDNSPVDGPRVFCKENAPGVQFIFGGAANLHLGDAALQLCAGPAPEGTDNYQEIAVWGQPQNYMKTDTREYRVGKTGSSTIRPNAVSVSQRADADAGVNGCRYENWYSDGGSITNPEYSLKAANKDTNPSDGTKPLFTRINHIDCADWSSTLFGNIPWPFVPVNTTAHLMYSNFDPRGSYFGNTCTPEKNCYDYATQRIGNVELRLGYNTQCGISIGIFTPNCTSPPFSKVDFSLYDGNQANPFATSDGQGSLKCSDGFEPTRTLNWWSIDITSCLDKIVSPANRHSKLTNLRVEIRAHCKACTRFATETQIEGVDLVVNTVANPTVADVKVVNGASGCRISPMGYGSGAGQSPITSNANGTLGRDCALISGGRVSIQGTIFAPSDALEISDADVLYPYASRGIVARHVRVRQYKTRTGYDSAAVSHKIDKTRSARVVNLVACRRANPTSTAPCDDTTDVILTRAVVTFDVDSGVTPSDPGYVAGSESHVPRIQSWDSVLD